MYSIVDYDATGIVVYNGSHSIRLMLTANISYIKEHAVSVERFAPSCGLTTVLDTPWYMLTLDTWMNDLMDINVSLPTNISRYVIQYAPCRLTNTSHPFAIVRLLGSSLVNSKDNSINAYASASASASESSLNNILIVLSGICIAVFMTCICISCIKEPVKEKVKQSPQIRAIRSRSRSRSRGLTELRLIH